MPTSADSKLVAARYRARAVVLADGGWPTLRLQPRTHARSPEVCAHGRQRPDAPPDTTRRRTPDRFDRVSFAKSRVMLMAGRVASC